MPTVDLAERPMTELEKEERSSRLLKGVAELKKARARTEHASDGDLDGAPDEGGDS